MRTQGIGEPGRAWYVSADISGWINLRPVEEWRAAGQMDEIYYKKPYIPLKLILN